MKNTFGLKNALIFTGLLLGLTEAYAVSRNGFNLDGALIPAAEIFHGGPPRDGIAAIDSPRFVEAENATLDLDGRVMGLYFQGQARAYPISILTRHEVVNDRFDNYHVAVTYCPLCGSGMVFRAATPDQALSFGVSGLLYNSDVLLYDRQTESLWSQLRMQAVSGERKGEKLVLLPAQHTSWGEWLRQYPDSRLLSFDTGFGFDYDQNPYQSYTRSDTTWFPVAHSNNAYRAKEWVGGVLVDGLARAYPFSALPKASGEFADQIGKRKIRLIWSVEAQSLRARDEAGRDIPVTVAYWFAWYGFYPQTTIYTPKL